MGCASNDPCLGVCCKAWAPAWPRKMCNDNSTVVGEVGCMLCDLLDFPTTWRGHTGVRDAALCYSSASSDLLVNEVEDEEVGKVVVTVPLTDRTFPIIFAWPRVEGSTAYAKCVKVDGIDDAALLHVLQRLPHRMLYLSHDLMLQPLRLPRLHCWLLHHLRL